MEKYWHFAENASPAGTTVQSTKFTNLNGPILYSLLYFIYICGVIIILAVNMARADLLKKLFISFKETNQPAFLEAARELIIEEKKKQHIILANELSRILENGTYLNPVPVTPMQFESIPKDSDRGTPLLEIRHPDRYVEDLILSTGQTTTLNNVAEEIREWDVLDANSLRPSNKLLFCGPPGCGKTATAEAMATRLRLPLLYVRFDSVVSSLLGETAANLRKVFDYASRGDWVILFDEFDAIGRSRDDSTEHGELKRVVNAFLQMLDRFTGRSVVIAATNFEQSLDPALWRRFDEIIRFELPTKPQVTELLKLKLRNKKYPLEILPRVSRRLYGMSHAEIERVCIDALKHLALTNKSEITATDFFNSVARQELRKQALARSQTTGKPKVNLA